MFNDFYANHNITPVNSCPLRPCLGCLSRPLLSFSFTSSTVPAVPLCVHVTVGVTSSSSRTFCLRRLSAREILRWSLFRSFTTTMTLVPVFRSVELITINVIHVLLWFNSVRTGAEPQSRENEVGESRSGTRDGSCRVSLW